MKEKKRKIAALTERNANTSILVKSSFYLFQFSSHYSTVYIHKTFFSSTIFCCYGTMKNVCAQLTQLSGMQCIVTITFWWIRPKIHWNEKAEN